MKRGTNLIAPSGELFGTLPALSSELEEKKKTGKEQEPGEGRGKGIQGGNPGRGQSLAVSSPETAGFDEFWKVYRVKKGKAAALRAWCKHGCAGFTPMIIATAERMQAEDRNWLEGFQPHASTWLNSGGWDDEPLPPVKPQPRYQTAAERQMAVIRRTDELFARLIRGERDGPVGSEEAGEQPSRSLPPHLVGRASDLVGH